MNIVSSKLPFNVENVSRCLCPTCPVQEKSACVSGKLATIKAALAKTPLVRDEIPGVYCSTGMATCKDLDPQQACLCGGCAIFGEYKLASGTPAGYYCRDGFAR
jgi:hypothetical protein